MKFKALLWTVALTYLVSCKTVSREEFDQTLSEISISLPKEFEGYNATAAFKRLDSTAAPKIVRGQDMKVKLPTGTYDVVLTITSKDGKEEYRSCSGSRPLTFAQPQEQAILDICRLADSKLVAQTLPVAVIVTPPKPTVEPPKPTVEPPPGPVKVPDDPAKPAPELFAFGGKCFGRDAAVTREGSELIIKLDDPIKDHEIKNANFLNCKLTMNIKKAVGDAYMPLYYKVNYTADADTLKEKLWITADAVDEKASPALPCSGFLFSSNTNSQKPIVCSFFEPVPGNSSYIPGKYKSKYKDSCKTESHSINLNLVIAGFDESYIYELKVPEIRVQIPATEKCIQ